MKTLGELYQAWQDAQLQVSRIERLGPSELLPEPKCFELRETRARCETAWKTFKAAIVYADCVLSTAAKLDEEAYYPRMAEATPDHRVGTLLVPGRPKESRYLYPARLHRLHEQLRELVEIAK